MRRLILKSNQSSYSRITLWWAGIHFACLSVALGCSTTSSPDYASLNLIDVRGTLTLDGKPLPNTELRFETPDEGIYSYAITDDSGRFRLMFDSRMNGILPGRKRIVVLPKGRAESDVVAPLERVDGLDEDEMSSSETLHDSSLSTRIPECYGRQSKKFVEVSSESKVIDIDLKSDCSDAS